MMSKLSTDGQLMSYQEVDALAAALAETGDFNKAVSTMDAMIAATPKGTNTSILKELEERRSRYALGLPLRISPAVRP